MQKKKIYWYYLLGKLIFAFIIELPLECKSHANHKSLSGHQQRKAAKDIIDKAENKGPLALVFDSLLSKIALPPPESYSQTLWCQKQVLSNIDYSSQSLKIHHCQMLTLLRKLWKVVLKFRGTNSSPFFAGFLTLPTAYVTGNPVECVVHPAIWNRSKLWDPQGVGRISQNVVFEDQFEEENVGYPLGSVSPYFLTICLHNVVV